MKTKLKNKQSLSKAMYDNFLEIRNNVGIIDLPYYSSEDERLNDKAFRELRPGQKCSMRDFLLKGGKIKHQRVQTACRAK